VQEGFFITESKASEEKFETESIEKENEGQTSS
jgi:hypothetical protein